MIWEKQLKKLTTTLEKITRVVENKKGDANMATKDITTFLPRTAKYINSLTSRQRIGHHNWVAEQALLDCVPAINSMPPAQQEKLDEQVLGSLIEADDPEKYWQEGGKLKQELKKW